MSKPSILYLHGFASGPRSAKARLMAGWAEAEGIPFVAPDLNGEGFVTLTVESQLVLARRALATLGGPVVVVGSSLGGYLGSLLVEEGAAVAGAVLMCPAFDFARRLARVLGKDAVAQWRKNGVMPVYHHAEGELRDVGVAILEEVGRHTAMPEMTVPCSIIHGINDVEVPIELSRLYAHDNPTTVTLHEVEDDHTLLQSLPRVVEETQKMLTLVHKGT